MTYHVLVLFIVMYYDDELLMLKSNICSVLFCFLSSMCMCLSGERVQDCTHIHMYVIEKRIQLAPQIENSLIGRTYCDITVTFGVSEIWFGNILRLYGIATHISEYYMIVGRLWMVFEVS